ncbi:helix-turn-helix domain-containing protein [Pseudovibrio brasiliensis]|uniref:Helix-turn-helix domain-containing protein n=1 Tax=Pseudovibrio brasiliensis TaxID=1898042 RepID=A0ABX8B125_9HYPH|nr:helix-turn-helix domain-containing protein [Pseudovibrio brasiliensis]QUS59156.1 helix-turn-helix domain-containing protein [Pseudovibrio brasiliensis]
MAKVKYPELGKFIAEHRIAAGIKHQVDLANHVKVKQQTVSRWEKGSSRPQRKQLAIIAEIIKCDENELKMLAGYGADRGAVVISFDEPFPIDSLNPDKFERFSLFFLEKLHPTADVHRAGGQGHKQDGLDVDAVFPDGRYLTFQCKRVEEFGPSKVKAAVAAHTRQADKNVIILSRIASPQARQEILKHDGWELWDKEDINLKIRDQLTMEEQIWLVDTFFSGQRFALLGAHEAGPWQNHEQFFAPFSQLVSGFHHDWNLLGREEDLSEILKRLEDKKTRLTLISAAGGVGKTRLLKEVIEKFLTKNKGTSVVYAGVSGDNISPANLEQLGNKRKIIVVDDAHLRDDMETLLQYTSIPNNKAKLIVTSRLYAKENCLNVAARYGLDSERVYSVDLERLTKEHTEQLATVALKSYGGPDHLASRLADLTRDCPLLTVIGAYVVAASEMHPDLMQQDEKFKRHILARFEDVIAGQIGTVSEAETIKKILKILALSQPVYLEDNALFRAIENVENVEENDARRAIKLLRETGVLLKRGARYRLAPDLLGDYIIETYCIDFDGNPNNYSKQVFEAVDGELTTNVLLNIGRLDWRRNEGDPSDSPLLDPIWSILTPVYEFSDPHVSAVKTVAYFQPKRGMEFVERNLLSGKYHRDFAAILRNVAYNYRFLKDACELLWEMAKQDERDTSPNPEHPVRVLCDLAAFSRNKDIGYNEAVVDFAIGLCRENSNWVHKYTPLDILRSGLSTEASHTYSKGPHFYFERDKVSLNAVASIRRKIINQITELIFSDDISIAMKASDALTDAIRYPLNQGREGWTEEFVETLRALKARLSKTSIDPLVWKKIADAINWHLCFSETVTKNTAEEVYALLPKDLETQVFFALLGGSKSIYYTRTGDFEQSYKEKQKEIARLANEFTERHSEVSSLYESLETKLQKIKLFAPNQHIASDAFIGAIIDASVEFCKEILARSDDPNLNLNAYAGAALHQVLDKDPDYGFELSRQFAASNRMDLKRAVTHAYGSVSASRELSNAEINLIECLAKPGEDAVNWVSFRCIEAVARQDLRRAVGIFLQLEFEIHSNAAEGLFFSFMASDQFSIELLQSDEVDQLVEKIKRIDEFEGYHLEEIIAEISEFYPSKALAMIMQRLKKSIDEKDWKIRPCNYGPYIRKPLKIRDTAYFEEAFWQFAAWVEESGSTRSTEWSYQVPHCFEGVFAPFDHKLVGLLRKWVERATPQSFPLIPVMLQHAHSTFVIEHSEFVIELLSRARALGHHEHATRMLAISASSGSSRSGTAGEPMPLDVQLRDESQKLLDKLPRLSPARRLYEIVNNDAKAEIKRSLKEREEWDD